MVTETQPEAPTEEQVIAPSGETPETPAPDAAAPETAVSPDAQSTDAFPAASEFNLDDGSEWKKVVGAPATPSETPGEVELPGQSLDDVAASDWEQQSVTFAALMQTFEQVDIQPFLREEWGLSPAQAQGLYQKVRPYVAEVIRSAEGHNFKVMDNLLQSLLSPEELEAYNDRDYLVRDKQGRVLPISSRAAAFEAVLLLREKRAHNDWQGRVDKGELFTKAQLKEAGAAAITDHQRYLEEHDMLKGVSSGTVVNGGAPQQAITYAQLLKMSESQVDALPEGMVSAITAKAISGGS